VREGDVELDDEVALLVWVVDVRHSLAWNGLRIARTVEK